MTLTSARKSLQAKHGTPQEFAEACNRAADELMITTAECEAAIKKYLREWAEAGEEEFEVLCSCGDVGGIAWNSSAERYESTSTGWLYDPDRLWNCGKPGHSQAGLRQKRNDPDLVPLKDAMGPKPKPRKRSRR